MRRHPSQDWWLAIGLATLAGYVDAIGFLHVGGFFVSFMSGNSTRLSVELAGHSPLALTAAGLILGFVAGVVAGSVAGRAAGRWRRPVVIALTALLLAMAAFTAMPAPGMVLLAGAMGALNAVFQRDGEVSIGVTYMTGTLVKLGQHLAGAMLGVESLAACVPYLLLWGGLVAGGVAGATTHVAEPGVALWAASAWALALALLASTMRDDQQPA